MTEKPLTTSKTAIRSEEADGRSDCCVWEVVQTIGYEMDLMSAVTRPRMVGLVT